MGNFRSFMPSALAQLWPLRLPSSMSMNRFCSRFPAMVTMHRDRLFVSFFGFGARAIVYPFSDAAYWQRRNPNSVVWSLPRLWPQNHAHPVRWRYNVHLPNGTNWSLSNTDYTEGQSSFLRTFIRRRCGGRRKSCGFNSKYCSQCRPSMPKTHQRLSVFLWRKSGISKVFDTQLHCWGHIRTLSWQYYLSAACQTANPCTYSARYALGFASVLERIYQTL